MQKKITYKTFRSKLAEKAKHMVAVYNAKFKVDFDKNPLECCECYKIKHPSFPEKIAYGYVLNDTALIFV